MLSPAREVPLSERVPPAQPAVRTARDTIAAGLLEGTPSHTSPAYRPLHFDVGAIEAAAAGGVPPEPEAPQEGYVADAMAPPAAASPAVVPLAAVPAAQAAAAGLPAQPAVAPHTGRSSARSYGSISSAAARELQRQAGERCVELVSARVPEAAARQLAEAGCDLDAFWAMPEADVVAACTGLPPLHVALLRRAHGRGVDGGPPASRPASRAAGSRPASRAGSAAGDGTVPQLPPLQRASPAPPLAPAPSAVPPPPPPASAVAPPPAASQPRAAGAADVQSRVAELQAARDVVLVLSQTAARDAMVADLDAQVAALTRPSADVAALEAAVAAMRALPPSAERDRMVAELGGQLAAASMPATGAPPSTATVHPPPPEAPQWWARCARVDCPCPASFDGLPGRHCSLSCHQGTPCSSAWHVAPSQPAPPAARGSAADAAGLQFEADVQQLRTHLGR